jgi:hypothetical protein
MYYGWENVATICRVCGEKGGRLPRKWTGRTDFPNSCVYTVQEKGWIDKDTFLEWIEKVWKLFTKGKTSTYLLMDEFAVHKAATCTKVMEECGTQFDLIYVGYTPCLQVLDVGVNKPFKNYIREGFNSFMLSNVEHKKPSRLDVLRWIAYACEKVTADTVCNTWNKIGYKV